MTSALVILFFVLFRYSVAQRVATSLPVLRCDPDSCLVDIYRLEDNLPRGFLQLRPYTVDITFCCSKAVKMVTIDLESPEQRVNLCGRTFNCPLPELPNDPSGVIRCGYTRGMMLDFKRLPKGFNNSVEVRLRDETSEKFACSRIMIHEEFINT